MFWNDVTDPKSYKRRCKRDNNIGGRQILKFLNGYTVEDFIKDNDLEGVNIEKFSSVPEIVTARGSYTVDIKHRKKALLALVQGANEDEVERILSGENLFKGVKFSPSVN